MHCLQKNDWPLGPVVPAQLMDGQTDKRTNERMKSWNNSVSSAA